jgi:hypothetical protein
MMPLPSQPIQLTPNSVTKFYQGVLIPLSQVQKTRFRNHEAGLGGLRRASLLTATLPTGGMPVVPGSSLFIPIDDPSELYIISTLADQDYAWLGV